MFIKYSERAFFQNNSACFQNAVISLGLRRIRLRARNRMIAEFSRGLGTTIGKLVLLPISQQIFHRLEFRRIGRQPLELNPTVLLGYKTFNQPTSMRWRPVPDHQHILGAVAHQMREKLTDLRPTDATRVQLKIKIPPRDPSHRRKRLQLKDYCSTSVCPLRRLYPATVGTLTQCALINKDYGAVLPLGFF
jgi:hypothetical protein